MDIFESLENLNVSEECFEDIVGLVEAILNESTDEYIKRKKLDPIHNMGVKMVKNAVPNTNVKFGTLKNFDYDKNALKEEPDKHYKHTNKNYSGYKTYDTYGDEDSSKYSFLGYDRNAKVMGTVGKLTGSQALQKAAEKTQKYSDLLKKARTLKQTNTDTSDEKKTKAEKGNKKTEERRWEDPMSYDNPWEAGHKGEKKGYPRNETPKSDEQRIADAIARNKAKREKNK